MKGLPQTLVHNFQFEFLERPQLIPFVRAKVSLCFYDDLLTSPKSQTSLAACVSLFVILALCCFFLLLFCFVLWWSGYQAVKQKIAIVQMLLHRTQASITLRAKNGGMVKDGFALLSYSSHKASRFSYSSHSPCVARVSKRQQKKLLVLYCKVLRLYSLRLVSNPR